MPWALIALFALLGWALFGWQVYRAGKRKRDMAGLQNTNGALQRALENERRLTSAQFEVLKNIENVDANSLNRILDRLRKNGHSG